MYVITKGMCLRAGEPCSVYRRGHHEALAIRGWRIVKVAVPSPHLRGALFAPVIVQGDIGIDRVDVVLPQNRKQHSGGSHQRAIIVVEELILDGWLHSHKAKAGRLQV